MAGDARPILPAAPGAVLDWLMPMHLVLDAEGRVTGRGPTVGRLFDGRPILGESLMDLFDLRSPRSLDSAMDFAGIAGQSLRLVPRGGVAGQLRLRGVLLPCPGPDGAVGWIVNLSFGIDLPRAVTLLNLTDADFAVTDLAMEMLYLVEANVAVTVELRALAQRLDGARRQAREEAETDPLTGLRNRRACDSILARLCRAGEGFALLHMDLDFFKAVNDTLGHAAGDHVLAHVAGVMKAASRAGDCLARVGGDEFVMILPGAMEAGTVREIAERMIGKLTQPIAWNDRMCRISASVGFVLVAAGGGAVPDQLLAEADAALYAAKKAGRGRVVQARPPQDAG